MKTRLFINSRRNSESGMAVLIILILLFIMVVFVAANTVTVNWLKAEVGAVDKRQTQRLASASTNSPPAATPTK